MKTYSDFNEISSQNEQRKNQILKGFSDNSPLDDNIQKGAGGEGSKGGKVIGHTKSGKPVYEPQSNKSSIGQNRFHNALGYTKQDHTDAAVIHRKAKETASKDDIPRHNLQAQYHDQAKGVKVEEPDTNPAGDSYNAPKKESEKQHIALKHLKKK